MIRYITIVLLWLFSLKQGSAAVGSIAGRVTAKGDADPLVGVTVLVQGSVRGTTTNARGEFRISDLAVGQYTLIFSMVGYQRESRSGLLVEPDREITVNVSMTQTYVQTEQIVVTANKREQSLQEVPVSLSVIDASDITRRNSLTIEEALRYVPGVNLTGGQANIRGSSGYSRGAGSRVLMLLDGVPFITGDTGELNFESIPVGQVDRIEVVKGASSALYGSSALGGVINVITKPISEVPETYVRTYGGFYSKPSHEQWRWSDKTRFFNGQSISHSLKVGHLGMALFFSRQLDDGYRENDYRRRYNFFLKAREEFSSSNSLTLNFGLLTQFGGQFVYWRNLDSALIPPVLQKDDNVKSSRYFISGLFNDALSENFLLTAKALWYHNEWGYETINAVGRTESLSDAFRAELSSRWLLGNTHSLSFGFEGQFDLVTADLFGNRSGGGFAFFLQDELQLNEELNLTLGARFDFRSLGLTGTSGELNPKAAVTYKPAEGTILRASFGRGFRVPSVAEAFISAQVTGLVTLPNADLKPERSYSYEVGVSRELGALGTVDFSAFRTDYDNLIEAGLSVDPSGSRGQIQWRNVTKARVQGIETSINLTLFDGVLRHGVGYTYAYPEDRTKQDLLKYRPRHILYVNTLAKVGWLSAGVDYRYVSRVDRVDFEFVELGIIPDGDERDDIYVTDVRLSADLSFTGVPLSATLNINNVFQHNYVELIGNLMPPRTYVLTLEAAL